MKLTGIPPHVAHVAHLAAIRSMRGELQALGRSMLQEFEKMLDDRTFGGVLSESRMGELIQKVVGSSIEGIKDQLNGMRNEMMINNEHNGADKVDTSRQSSFESQLFCIHTMECYGVFRLVGSSHCALWQLNIACGILEIK